MRVSGKDEGDLTCPFNTIKHLHTAREQKSTKSEYQLLISLDHLGLALYTPQLKLVAWDIFFPHQ